MLYAFFGVIPQHVNFICQCFWKETATWNMIDWSLPPHDSLSSPQHVPYLLRTCIHGLHVGCCPPQPVSVLGIAPTLSPYFWLAQAILEPNLFPYKYPNIVNPSHSSYLPAYEDGTECSKTLVYKIQTPGSYPEETIQQCVVLLNEHSKEYGILPLMHGVAAVARHLLSFWSVMVYHILCKSWTLALQSLKTDARNHHIVAL